MRSSDQLNWSLGLGPVIDSYDTLVRGEHKQVNKRVIGDTEHVYLSWE
jgi:hypothetical protein